MDSSTDYTIRTILLATDFSRHSEQAKLAARDLADHFGAKLHVLHVVPDATGKGTAMRELEAFSAPSPRVVNVLEIGKASREIVRYARDERVDIIIMGTHGRTGVKHLAFGSVAEAVVRSAPCPVLTVKLPAERAASAPSAAPTPPRREEPDSAVMGRCLLCAKPSGDSVCPACKAHVEGEARERRRRDLGAKT